MRYRKLSALASIMAAAVTLAAPAHADVDTDFANQLHDLRHLRTARLQRVAGQDHL